MRDSIGGSTRRLVMGAGLALPLSGRAFGDVPYEPTFDTASGRIRGRRIDGVCVFKGVPYGASTAGDHRYRPARPPEPWAGVRDAFNYGDTAPQLRLVGQVTPKIGMSNSPNIPESEDCLVLNIWSPSMTGRSPIMLYVHGGGFTLDSGSSTLIDGANLAREQNVVVMTLNHRLGPLGYADLGAVADGFEGVGLLGQTDIAAAMNWVKAHADRFGGDPSRVLLFGEFGGGVKVSIILGMPSAEGLFHRAAIESGSLRTATPRDQTAATAEALLRELGLTRANAGDIRRAPLDRLMAAALAVAAEGFGRGFACAVDGALLPANPFSPDRPPVSAHVPIIVGYNRLESAFLKSYDEGQFSLDRAGFNERLRKLFNDRDLASLVEIYRAENPGAPLSEIYLQIDTDHTMGSTSRTLAERKAAAGAAPAYLYRFDWRTPVDGGKWGASHTLEIPFVFDNIKRPGIAALVGDNPPVPLARAISGAWASFARTGDPNHPGLPHWPPYSASWETMLFSGTSTVVADPQSDERKAMEAAIKDGPDGGTRAN